MSEVTKAAMTVRIAKEGVSIEITKIRKEQGAPQTLRRAAEILRADDSADNGRPFHDLRLPPRAFSVPMESERGSRF
jgi:hypothetical protein